MWGDVFRVLVFMFSFYLLVVGLRVRYGVDIVLCFCEIRIEWKRVDILGFRWEVILW